MPRATFKIVAPDYNFASSRNEEREFATIDAEFIIGQCQTEEDIIELARDADAIVADHLKITRRAIESLENCKVIARGSMGVDTIVDIPAATEHGICVVNVPDYCVEEVSTHAMALLLACVRKITLLHDNVMNGKWDYQAARPIHRVAGQTLGIVGYGQIARALVPKAKGFALNILAHNRHPDRGVLSADQVKPVTFDQLLAESDFVSIHVPLSDATRHMFGEDQFKLMKQTAYLINTSRGMIVDTSALYTALTKGEIAGAALDTTPVEPIDKDDPLLGLDNVIITPHSAWYSQEAVDQVQTSYAQDVVRVLTGRAPLALVNPEVRKKVSLA